jgi:hypothetical protein
MRRNMKILLLDSSLHAGIIDMVMAKKPSPSLWWRLFLQYKACFLLYRYEKGSTMFCAKGAQMYRTVTG